MCVRVCVCVCVCLFVCGSFHKFLDIFVQALNLSLTLEYSVCYCYTSYEITDEFL